MKKVLIIGASSYIGINFFQYVSKYHKDNIIVDMVSGANGEWKHKDFRGYDVILLLSAIVHKKEKKGYGRALQTSKPPYGGNDS